MFRLAELQDGNLYAGTEAGAFRLQGGKFVPVSEMLPRDGVTAFARDAAGALWIGTVDSGLLRLDAHGVERFDSTQGLPNNRVPSLFVDREGSIWAGTNGGLLRLRDAPFTTYPREQGLPTTTCARWCWHARVECGSGPARGSRCGAMVPWSTNGRARMDCPATRS